LNLRPPGPRTLPLIERKHCDGRARNPRYSQMVGRDELFERRYEAAGAPEIPWHTCERACAAAIG